MKYGKEEVYVEYNQEGEIIKQSYPLDNIGNNQEFIKTLQTKKIETIHSGETSMSDIFIKVTGGIKNE
jgi:fluoroquinolone transport system ATP-binding protein